MQDKLRKVLQIKIDAINKNIENLNYLNGELDKNNESLAYIKEKIALFKNNELLNLDQIEKEDFEKILLMIDPSITDIFRDKTCSYDGIIYIIEGIRKSISLQLTESQTKAILSFVEGMKMKSINLQDVINNLIESKNRLPETNLDTLTETLNNYEEIADKYENNLYLTEIDDIEEALTFADSPLEEKVDMFEYLLKYNSNIYTTKLKEEEKEVKEETSNDFDLPIFNYEPLDTSAYDEKEVEETENIPAKEPEKEEVEETEEEPEVNIEPDEEENIHDIKFNLDHVFDNNTDEEKTPEIELPPVEGNLPSFEDVTPDFSGLDNVRETPEENNFVEPELPEMPEISINEELSVGENVEEEKVPDTFELPVESGPQYDEIQSPEENHELNTVELEDIIKKIDARLKEMEPTDDTADEPTEEIKFENNTFEASPLTFNSLEETTIDYTDLLNNYALPEMKITNKSKEDVEGIINFLNDNKVLDSVKNNKEVLESILSKCSKGRIEEITNLIKENLLVKKDEFDYVLDIMLRTMPILFTKEEVLDSFKANIEFFKEKKLNIINLFDNYRELLIMNNNILKDNYKKVEQYGFQINNENVKYYLYNVNIVKNIDSYIEALGYEKGFLGRDDYFDGVDYIKKNPYKLNDMSKDTLMKLRYSSENNQKIYGNKPGILSGEISNPKVDILTLTDDYKNTFFTGEYSSIDRNEYLNLKKEMDELKDYDLNIDEIIRKLDGKYKNGDLRYKFGNVLISRIKTIRLYNFLKNKGLSSKNTLLIALTYNTVLKNDEYNEIEKIVDSLVGGGN